MSLFALKSKIHLACVTGAELNYDGSLSIDEELMLLANIHEYEQLQVYNNTNGNRYTTYAIKGKAGSREICAHGAGAHLISPGDRIIICTYKTLLEKEFMNYAPNVIRLDEVNNVLPPKTTAQYNENVDASF